MVRAGDFLSDLGAEQVIKLKKKRSSKKEPAEHLAEETLYASFADRGRLINISIGLVAVATVGFISINALFLQNGSHPAPLFQDFALSPDVEIIQTASIPQPRAKEINLKSIQAVKVDPLVSDIQRHLAARGYYNADVDGVIGNQTRQAIGSYQETFGQTVDYEPSSALLQHIRLSSPDPDFHAAARARIAKLEQAPSGGDDISKIIVSNTVIVEDADSIKRVQRALRNLEYGDLDVDGLIGANTRKALRSFERDYGLRETGTITTAVISELSRLNQL